MPTLSFEEARACVLREVAVLRRLGGDLCSENVTLEQAAGRVLARDACADRDYPPLDRSIRDGFAVRAADLPGRLPVTGEVRAGETFAGSVGLGEAVEIMTGAAVPDGADAVVMVEHVTRDGDTIETARSPKPGEFVNRRGSESRKGDTIIPAGKRLDFSDVALLATVGITKVPVFMKPRVAILATGDEIVPPEQTPEAFQIRNSNVYSLAVQVRHAGGVPYLLPVAPDRYDDTRWLIEKGLQMDLLLLSGGVSAGKYDLVETVLADLGASFFFDRVGIQPGQPLVFGQAPGDDGRPRVVFGLPGNPASTMVTFEIFARAALELLSGQTEAFLPLTHARLAAPFRHKKGLTRFLPARLHSDGRLSHIPWQGSSDVPAISRANAFLVADADRESWEEGEWIRVLLK